MNFIVKALNGGMGWVEERAPGLMPAYRKHMSEYYAPKNFNLWYYFGSLAMLVLVNQIVTGIFLTMHYKPSAAEALRSRSEAALKRSPIGTRLAGSRAVVPSLIRLVMR